MILMILMGLVVLMTFFLLWVVFVPVYFRVKSSMGQYEIGQTFTFKISLHPDQVQMLEVHVFGFLINAGKTVKPGAKTCRPAKKRKKQTLRRSRKAWRPLMQGIFRSFRLKRLIGTVDFEDPILNALFFPAMYYVSRGSIRVSINFMRTYYLDFEGEVRINVALWSFIRFLTKI